MEAFEANRRGDSAVDDEASRQVRSRPVGALPEVEALPPLSSYRALGVFDEAIRFLRAAPSTLLGVTVAVLLPLRLLATALPGSPLRDARPDQLLDIFVGNLSSPGAVTAAFAVVAADSLALFTVATVYGEAIASWYSRQPVTTADLLLGSIKRSPSILLAWVLVHVIEILGALASFGFLAVLAAVFLVATAPVMGAEAAGPIASMRRSSFLAQSALGHTFFVVVTVGLGSLLMRVMIEGAPSLLGFEVFQVPLWLLAGVMDFVASVVVISFVAASSCVAYIGLRVRREGIDLEMQAARAFAPRARRQRGHR